MANESKTKIRLHLAWWQVLVVFLLMTVVSATLLRINNVGMVQRRDAVLQADEAGDYDALEKRLFDLENYVFSHMNTSTGDFWLVKTYEVKLKQIVEQAKASLPQQGGQTAQRAAADVCDKRYGRFAMPYVNCFVEELKKHTTAYEKPVEIKTPNPNIYKKNYLAPIWSPDLAGLAVLVWFGLLAYLLLRTISNLLFRLLISVKKY